MNSWYGIGVNRIIATFTASFLGNINVSFFKVFISIMRMLEIINGFFHISRRMIVDTKVVQDKVSYNPSTVSINQCLFRCSNEYATHPEMGIYLSEHLNSFQ